jgi:hypothetical protein
MDRLLQRKNIINTGRITPLPGSQNPESKAGKVQEKIGETMAETKGRIEQAVGGPEWQQKAQARGR